MERGQNLPRLGTYPIKKLITLVAWHKATLQVLAPCPISPYVSGNSPAPGISTSFVIFPEFYFGL